MAGNLIPDMGKRPDVDFKVIYESFRKKQEIKVEKLNDEIKKANEELGKTRKKFDDLMYLVMDLLDEQLDKDTVKGLGKFHNELKRIIDDF